MSESLNGNVLKWIEVVSGIKCQMQTLNQLNLSHRKALKRFISKVFWEDEKSTERKKGEQIKRERERQIDTERKRYRHTEIRYIDTQREREIDKEIVIEKEN